jgi:hypothetical protein
MTLTDETFTLSVEPTFTIADFKTKIHHEGGLPAGIQHLIFNGKEVEDDHTLSDYNIWNDSILHLVKGRTKTICVKDERGGKLLFEFKMNQKSKMEKMFSAYASRGKVDVSSLRFFSLRNEAIHADDTPESLCHDDNENDHIDLLVIHSIMILVKVKDERGEELLFEKFKMNRKTKMEQVFSAYASEKKVDVSSLRFFSLRNKDKAIHADDTPESLGYDVNGYHIDLLVIHSIMIRLKDERGEELRFQMNRKSKMATLFSAYASRKKVDVSSLRFFSLRNKDKAIHADDTPETLDYNDDDDIDGSPCINLLVRRCCCHVCGGNGGDATAERGSNNNGGSNCASRSIASYFQVTKNQHSMKLDPSSSSSLSSSSRKVTPSLPPQHEILQSNNTPFQQSLLLPCRYCDRPTCHNNPSCIKQCEECQNNFCSFCCTVNYTRVYEKTVCFECDELIEHSESEGEGEDECDGEGETDWSISNLLMQGPDQGDNLPPL